MISNMPAWLGNLLESAMGPAFTVTDTILITPGVKKIRFTGSISKMNFLPGGASVIRVSETEYRNYTIAYYDKTGGFVEILFHIHGKGVGSTYIDSLQIGDKIHISYARGHKLYDQKFSRFIVFGDETAIGLACSLQQMFEMNNQSFGFCFELDAINRDGPALAGLRHFTVFPKDGSFRNGQWVGQLELLNAAAVQDTRFILAGNAKSVQVIRKVLKGEGASNISSQGYWMEGRKGL